MQSRIFDLIARSFPNSFSYDELWNAVRTDPRWTKTQEYFDDLLEDRIARRMIERAGNTYTVISTVLLPLPAHGVRPRRHRATRGAALPPNTILYNNEFGYTVDFNALISSGLTFDHNGNKPIIHLTKVNSNRIEPLVNRYYPPNAKNRFNALYNANPRLETWSFDNVLEMVKIINNDNHTRASNNQMRRITDFIIDQNNNFWNLVIAGDIDLIDTLIDYVYEGGLGIPKSLCSKVCKYLSEFANKRINPQLENNYYFINDKVVRAVMNYYFDYYRRHVAGISTATKIERGPWTSKKRGMIGLSYRNLYTVLNELYINECPLLTRTQFDHILWFCYKSYTNAEL